MLHRRLLVLGLSNPPNKKSLTPSKELLVDRVAKVVDVIKVKINKLVRKLLGWEVLERPLELMGLGYIILATLTVGAGPSSTMCSRCSQTVPEYRRPSCVGGWGSSADADWAVSSIHESPDSPDEPDWTCVPPRGSRLGRSGGGDLAIGWSIGQRLPLDGTLTQAPFSQTCRV
jgi:hypothetical protein